MAALERGHEIWQRDGEAASQYERCAVPYLLGPWAPDLVKWASPRSGEQVLDVACGTGLVSRLAAQCVGPRGRVTGLDILPAMLAVARAWPPGRGAPIEWREGDATALPFPDAAFDVVFCHQGLQFFPDRRAALREIHRVLAPGGRVAFGVWSRIERNPYFRTLADAVERHVGTEAARQMRGSFALGEPGELGSLLEAAGFVNAVVRPLQKLLHLPPPGDFILPHLAGTSLAPTVKALEAGARAGLIEDAIDRMQPYRDQAGMAFPFEIQVAYWPPGPTVHPAGHAGRQRSS